MGFVPPNASGPAEAISVCNLSGTA